MATFVLVHGAFAGGWQMSGVAALLRQAGHIVVTPTLTGLAERADRLSPEVELGIHVRDVVVLLKDEGLNDMALLGKSYSGLVVTAAAEQILDRVRHLVYLDALVSENGQSMLDVFGPEHTDVIRRVVRERGDGWRLPVDGAVATRLSDHPCRTFTEAVEVTNPRAVAIPRTYIRCTGASETRHSAITAQMGVRTQSLGWGYADLATGHDPERDEPEAVAAILGSLA